MFYKRTIKPHKAVTRVDTASEALAVSLSEKGKVDLPFMQNLTGQMEIEIIKELEEIIFKVPQIQPSTSDFRPLYVTADEYLSGNVREKLALAEMFAKDDPAFEINVEKLKAVIPKDIPASEINVKLR